jgi:hypothetical protein
MYVVEDHGHAVAGRFRQSDISRDDAFENLRSEETSKIGSDLF